MTKQQQKILARIQDRTRQLEQRQTLSYKRLLKKAIQTSLNKLQSLNPDGKACSPVQRMIGELSFQHDLLVMSYHKTYVSVLISEHKIGIMYWREEKVKTATRLYELLNY